MYDGRLLFVWYLVHSYAAYGLMLYYKPPGLLMKHSVQIDSEQLEEPAATSVALYFATY